MTLKKDIPLEIDEQEKPDLSLHLRNMRKSIKELAEFYMDDQWVRTYGAKTFSDLMAAEDAAKASTMVRKRAAQLLEMIFDVVWDVTITNKPAAFETLFNEFVALASEIFDSADIEEDVSEGIPVENIEFEEIDLAEFDAPDLFGEFLSEAELEILAKITEDVAAGNVQANRAPLFADLAVIEPGWGNSADNHYYSKEMLEQFGHVFTGAKMYETDHDESRRSTNSWVSTSTGLVRFSETGAPIHRVYIHDPDFAEKMRNLDSAGLAKSMECSILAGGRVEKKKFKDSEGREGRRVTEISDVHAVDWVTRGGAGGHVETLIETHNGGSPMSVKDKAKQILQEALTKLEENDNSTDEVTIIQETDTPDDPIDDPADEPIEYLEAAEVSALVDDTMLKQLTKDRLNKGKYTSLQELKTAVDAAVAETKAISGSGNPFDIVPIDEIEENLEEGYIHFDNDQYEKHMSELEQAAGIKERE